MAKLTRKQRVFIDEYMKDFNATAAAIRAGYSERSANNIGPGNLLKPIIAEEIERRIAERAMGPDEVLQRLGDMARGDMADFLTIVDGVKGVAFVDLEKAKAAGLTHLIKKYKYNPERGIEIDLHDAQAALALLAKHHKLLTDRIEHSGEINVKGYRVVSPDDWDEGEEGEDA